MILKEAIRLNLAGMARNLDDGTVQFSLQGRSQRIRNALASIRKGTQKSKNVTIQTSPSTFDPGLTTFTVFGWTSTSRQITNSYDHVFTLRKYDRTVSQQEAQAEYQDILRRTLSLEDQAKLGGKKG